MRPLALSERLDFAPTLSLAELLAGESAPLTGDTDQTLQDYTREILASGFPELRGLSWRGPEAQLDSYVARVVDHDLAELGSQGRNPIALGLWMTAYAAATSTTASFEAIRYAATAGRSDKPARATLAGYRDALERLWFIEPVPAWQPRTSQIRLLGQAQKHQLADPALAAHLLGVDAPRLLSGGEVEPRIHRDGTTPGALFESRVTQSVRVYAQAARAGVFHLRTRGGEHEVDLILERRDGRVLALEVKLSRTIDDRDVRHRRWLRETIGEHPIDAAVITTGPGAHRWPDGIAVIPAALPGP